MLAIFQVLTIGAMVVATYLLYQALGVRRGTLLFTQQEKQDWDDVVQGALGKWLTSSNIFATLTSLATVYVFFIGNTYSFGGWVLMSILTMFLGAFVTQYVTRVLLNRRGSAGMIGDGGQASSVLLALFWSEDPAAKATTRLIKLVTMVNIVAVLWLDFTVFADISSHLIGSSSLFVGVGILFFCSLSVLHFTIKFGLRGFVFADLFQSPLIILGSFILLFGSLTVVARELSIRNGVSDFGAVALQMRSVLETPAISTTSGILFSISCLFLNSFLMLVTPPHWLRMWAFGRKEITLQVRSIIGTSLVWLILVVIGALASVYVSRNAPAVVPDSNEVVVLFLNALAAKGSILFAVAFWIAGMAALFASADVQIYSFWLVHSYDTENGALSPTQKLDQMPLLIALSASILFSGVYVLVRHFALPLDRLVLVLLPSCLTIVPSLIIAIRGAKQEPIYPAVSIALYILFGIGTFASRDHGESFSVAAPIGPLLISFAAFFLAKRDGNGATAEN